MFNADFKHILLESRLLNGMLRQPALAIDVPEDGLKSLLHLQFGALGDLLCWLSGEVDKSTELGFRSQCFFEKMGWS